MYYAPWWLLVVCLAPAGLAAYLALRGTNLSRRTLYALTVALSPVVLLGVAVVAVVLSTALSGVLEPASQSPTQPGRTELTSPEAAPEPTNPVVPEETVPETTGPTASPGASPSASPAASSASAAAGG